mmetsp:Transcript_18832/g.54490  ORF Transcript_18832/g.54490 Transcript_18832/m.54490 type:complete len:721 (-) Transcript_18832:17-2179(-)
MYARLDDANDRPREYYLLRNMAGPQDDPPGGGAGGGGAKLKGRQGKKKKNNNQGGERPGGKGGKNGQRQQGPGMGPHGRIFLGKDKATFGEDGVGYVPYDPDYECGGPAGAEGRTCPHVLEEGGDDALGLESRGRKGRLLHVGIASYRDPLCPRTLYNMFTKSVEPENIRVRVLQQNDPKLDIDCLEGYCKMIAKAKAESRNEPFDDSAALPEDYAESCPHADQVNIHQVHAREAKGPTWARGLLSADFEGAHASRELSPQDHCMSIDSHMDFEPRWDANMIDMWDLADNEYAVLSTYVAGTEQLGKNLNGMHEVPHLCMVTFTSNVRTHATKMAQELSRPKLTNAIWGAGLSFSKCHAELKVPVDPHTPYVFDGEEFNRAARFFTHGYDVYTPHRVYVLHDYHGSQSNPTTASWHRNTDHDAMKASHKRLKTMIEMPGGESDPNEALRIRQSKYGMGDRRSVDQLVEFSGVDTRNAKFPVDGRNRCGNLRWVPFAPHPRGVNYVPRYDDETEDPLATEDNFPPWEDSTSVWYDPSRVVGAAGGGKMSERDTRMKPMEEDAVEEEEEEEEDADINDEDKGVGMNAINIPHRDHEAHDAHENLHRHHEELRRAMREADRMEEEAARPVISNAEAHHNGGLLGGALRGGNGNADGGAGAAIGGRKLIDRAPTAEHGWSHLPLTVQIVAGCLVAGLAVTLYLTAGTGKGALAERYKRRRRKAV